MHPPRRLSTQLSLFVTALAATVGLSPRSAQAEYRAFQLVVTNTKTNQSRTVLTTLDDIQYPGYHPLNADETVTIQDTWRCWERSEGFKEICPNPRPPSNLRAPANAAPGAEASPSAKSSSAAP